MVCVFVSELSQDSSLVCRDPEGISKELFLPFRCFCTRKDVSILGLDSYLFPFVCILMVLCNEKCPQIQCQDVLLEETDIAKALVEYANQAAIEVLVVGSSNKGGFLR